MAEHYFTRDFSLQDLPVDPAIPARTPEPDKKVIPMFFIKDIKDETRSASLGRAAYRSVEMIKIIIPGDKHNQVERRVRENDKHRFPRHYEAFKKRQEVEVEGTRLDLWPLLSRDQVSHLNHIGLFTIEQLAELSDERLPSLGIGGRHFVKHARAYLEHAKTGAVPSKLVHENEELRAQVKRMTEQMSDLTRKMESLMRKAGEEPSEADSPVLQAKLAMSAANKVDLTLDIPDDFIKLPFPRLKELVAKIPDAPQPLTKDHALEIVAEYKGRQNAIKG